MSDTPQQPGAPAVAPTAAQSGSEPSRLDGVLVIGVLLIVAGVLFGLFQVADIKATLPIIASVVSALISAVIAGYAGYRWGASMANKKDAGGGAVQ